ncbi:MAG: sodium:solute symporter, partial [Massilia sp.]|nr:sodium:solute symporter [Massilia sp.]
RATTQGAIASVVVGIAVWLLFFPQLSNFGAAFPGQLAGLLAGFAAMVLGSLLPQVLQNRHDTTRTMVD